MRHAKMIKPCAFVKANRIDDQCIAFPLADRNSIKSRIRIFGKLASVGPYRAVRMRPLKKLKDSVLGWNHLHSKEADFENDVTHQSKRIAISCRIVSQCRRDGAWSVCRPIRIE